MNRRFFLKILLGLGLGAYFPKIADAAQAEELHEPQENYKPLTSIKFLRQIVTDDSRTSRIFMWNADEEIKNARLEYFLVGEDAANFGNVVVDYFEQSGEATFIYSCALKNLKPESLYKFRIISEDGATKWQNFRTAGFGNFQMLVFSDSQCVNYNVWKKTADTAEKNFPDAEIVTVVGDLVDNGQAAYQWRAWHESAAKVLHERIFAPVMGNHECYGLDWLNCLPTGYLHHFRTPTNDAKKFDGYFYSFDYGAAHFFVLNTQFLELDKINAGLRDAQEYWFRRDEANTNRRWKIVLMHKDIYDYAQDKFNDIAEIFMGLFDELNIDLILTGHLHTYRNRGHIFARQKSDSGPCYVLCGRSGDQKYVEPHSDVDDVAFENLREEPESYIALDVSEKKLTLTCKTVDGKILDNFTLEK